MLSPAPPIRRIGAWAAITACALLFAALRASAQGDPPDQAGRVSAISGTVSIQPAGTNDWGQAYPNLPVGPGDRIFTDQDGQVEVQVGQSYLRIGPNTDITLVNDSPEEITFGMAQGAAHVRSFGLWPGQGLDLSTPNGDVRLAGAGELRVDVMPDQGATVFTAFGNGVDVSGAGGFEQPLGNWQALEVAGTNPVYPEWLQPEQPDFLDQWSQQRDRQILDAMSYRYVNPDVPGAADLDAYGEWVPESDYGPIWYPRGVPADWQPYHYGHWINREPWGWVWVEDEPWGYAPFHYGRWVVFRGRWGWVPGPREERPVWSPALVVFAGGGVGVSAWFPLGPGEPYRPWYHCSPHYIDRVNITNIHESRIVHVQNTYVNVTNVTNITYINRTAGVTAMRQDDFAAGRSARVAGVNIDRRQFEHPQVVEQPAPVTRQSFITRPVAHPVHVTELRPTFINHQGMQISANPSAPPQAPAVRQTPFRPLPGRTVVQPPPTSRFQTQGGGQPQPAPNQGGRPMPPYQNQGRQDQGRPQNYPNQQPPNGYQQPNNGQQPNQPVAPAPRPWGRPIPSPRGGQEGNPNQPQYTPPANEHQQPNQGQPERRDYRQPQPNPPQYNPPPQNNRQDYGRGRDERPPQQPPANNPQYNPPPNQQPNQPRYNPPPNNPPQQRPAPPQRFEERPAPPPQQERPAPPQRFEQRPAPPPPQERPSERPAPPPANMHSQPAPPPQQARPNNNDNRQNNRNDNNEKKDDKKHN